MAERQDNTARLEQLKALRAERFELMERLAQAAVGHGVLHADHHGGGRGRAFLDAMRRAHIKGALVGVEAVTPEGLKDVYKGFNDSGEALVTRLRTFREHGVHVLGSFIFGLPSDRAGHVRGDGRHRRARRPDLRAVRDADAVPGTVDFAAWEKKLGDDRDARLAASRSPATG